MVVAARVVAGREGSCLAAATGHPRSHAWHCGARAGARPEPLDKWALAGCSRLGWLLQIRTPARNNATPPTAEGLQRATGYEHAAGRGTWPTRAFGGRPAPGCRAWQSLAPPVVRRQACHGVPSVAEPGTACCSRCDMRVPKQVDGPMVEGGAPVKIKLRACMHGSSKEERRWQQHGCSLLCTPQGGHA